MKEESLEIWRPNMYRSTSQTSLTKAWKDGEDRVRNLHKYTVLAHANAYIGPRNDCFSFRDCSQTVDLRSQILQTTAQRLITAKLRVLL